MGCIHFVTICCIIWCWASVVDISCDTVWLHTTCLCTGVLVNVSCHTKMPGLQQTRGLATLNISVWQTGLAVCERRLIFTSRRYVISRHADAQPSARWVKLIITPMQANPKTWKWVAHTCVLLVIAVYMSLLSALVTTTKTASHALSYDKNYEAYITK